MSQPCNNRGTFLFLLLLLIFSMPALGKNPSSLSDISLDSFKTIKEQEKIRNPFSPVATDAAVDPSTLDLQGIVVGPSKKFCLISDKILRVGDSIGSFVIHDIQPNGVSVQWAQGITHIPMESYVPQKNDSESLFEIVFQKAEMRQAIRLLATAGNFNIIMPEDLSGRVSVIFHQIPLRNALGAILRVNQLEFAEENNIVRVGKPQDFTAGSYFDSQFITLKYATAKDLIETVKSQLSDKGTVTADDRTNTLIVKDSQSVMDDIQSLITTLDQADTQVRIEAKIVGVTRSFARSLGIQWGITKTSGDVQGFGAPTAGVSPLTGNPININVPATAPTSGLGILLGSLGQNMSLDAQLTAAETRGDAKVISQPSITTINNTAARIRSGVKLYVKTTSSISVGGSGGSASADDSGLEEIDTGIMLAVTPQISVDNTVKLKIDAEESEADFASTVDGIPSVRDNTASTTVLVKNGSTTVIGGLMKVNKSNSSSGVPFISSIPIFGWFFKNKTKQLRDSELLIFITPYIVGKEQTQPSAPNTSSQNNSEPKNETPQQAEQMIQPTEQKIIYTPQKTSTSRKSRHKYH